MRSQVYLVGRDIVTVAASSTTVKVVGPRTLSMTRDDARLAAKVSRLAVADLLGG